MTAGKPKALVFRWRWSITHSAMPPTRRLVALVYSTYADADGGSVRPSMQTVALDTGLGLSTVRRESAELRAGEWLGVEPGTTSGGYDERHRPIVPVYTLTIPAGFEPVEREQRRPGRPLATTNPLHEREGDSGKHPLTHAQSPSHSRAISLPEREGMSSVTSPERSSDGTDLFAEVLNIESERRADSRIRAGKVDRSKRRGYVATIVRNLAVEQGDEVRTAIEANPSATAAELAAILWPAPDEHPRYQPLRLADEPSPTSEPAADLSPQYATEAGKAGAFGAHRRWHIIGKRVSDSCPYCVGASKGPYRPIPRESKSLGAIGAHQRWHEARGITSPDCPYCAPVLVGNAS